MTVALLLVAGLANRSATATMGGCVEPALWLDASPRLAAALVWEDAETGEGRARAWPHWRGAARQALARQVVAACRHLAGKAVPDETFPETLPNAANDGGAVTALSPGDARRFYFTTVAQILALEITRALPWSILDLDPESLEVLFDSRHYAVRDAKFGVYRLDAARHGFVGPARPWSVHAFLRRHRLLGPTRRESIVRLLNWAMRLQHDVMPAHLAGTGLTRESPAFLVGYWQYQGFPPLLRLLAGTVQTIDPAGPRNVRHWTPGCWGTAGFLRHVLRVVGIPVAIEAVDGHASPRFLSDHLRLSHGDDPYNQMTLTSPLPRKAAGLLIAEDAWRELRARRDPSRSLVGYGPARLALVAVPDVLVDMGCVDRDRLVGGEMRPHFSDVELARARFWQRLERLMRAKCPARSRAAESAPTF